METTKTPARAGTPAHTPGPWRTRQMPDGKILVLPENNLAVADCCDMEDGRLIAAAPDLADALDWALDQIEDDLSPDHQEALDHARAVLARARGVQS